MQQQKPKSATTAGLLGIFLGAFGAHNWYLNDKKKGVIHVCLVAGGFLLEIVAAAILPNVLNFYTLLQMAWLISILSAVGGLAISASGIWGLVEGIMLLVQGDAGLASKGYFVAQPAMGYGYPQPYGPQGYSPQNQYQNPGYNDMNQGFNGQPMPPINNQTMFNQPMGNGYNQPPMNNGFNQPMNENFGQPNQSNQPNQPINNDYRNNNMGSMNGMDNDQNMQNGNNNGQ